MVWAVLIAFIGGGLFGVLVTCIVSYDRTMNGKKHWWEE